MTRIRIGGVPEHFNLPWHLAFEEGLFEAEGIELEWKDFPGGTGAMTRELNHHQLDVAVLLTEGMTTAILNGTKAKMLQFYVATPLTWGVFVNAASSIERMNDVAEKKFAISRIGSGSHLMARVFANEHNYQLHPDDPFKVVSDLDGAVKEMRTSKELLFLWEEFTTKHLVDSGEFRMIEKYDTPWPCFVIAARNAVITRKGQAISKMLDIINRRAVQFKQDREGSIELVAQRYGLSIEDATTWFDRTAWQGNLEMNSNTLQKVVQYLNSLGITEKTRSPKALVSKFTKLQELVAAQ